MSEQRSSTAAGSILYLLFFVSGFAALVYQVLWLKELRLLFGSTAQAAGATLAVFFLGLAVGGAAGGRWAERTDRPLRAYALAEVGIALAAGLYFLLSWLYQLLYATFFGALLGSPWLALGLKAFLALLLLFPAAFFLGTTLPLMGQVIVRRPATLGTRASWLYALNTVGAALGAFAAGFYLPALWGFTASYLLPIGLNLAVAAAAWALSRGERQGVPGAGEPALAGAVTATPILPAAAIYGVAFFSGVTTLALEVLWTRMLSLVFQNSVYSFSAILVVFLAALALGSALAHALAHRRAGAGLLSLVLAAAGAAIFSVPFVFVDFTSGLRFLGTGQDWGGYVGTIFKTALVAMLLPGLLAGAVFPYCFKLAERMKRAPGLVLGRLAAVNTLGAIAGALAGGFLLLPTLGLWKSLFVIAVLYFLVAALVLDAIPSGALWPRIAQGVLVLSVPVVLGAYYLDYLTFPVTRARADLREAVLEEWEGSLGTVAVIERGRTRRESGTLSMRLNNHYTLGTAASLQFERGQADLPMLLHPRPEEVFFLGMGTGVTASAALAFPVQKVVITELVPEVVEAARKYFRPYLGSLFEDGRVRIATEDGRNYLRATPERFDVIVADLFLPWGAGTGGLYSLQHFQTVRSRLAEGGIFAQWLPMYQLSPRDFHIICRTMLEVFPQVTMWRGDFFANRPIVALIGQEEGARLRPEALTRIADILAEGAEGQPGQVLPFLLYGGNLSPQKERFADYPVNTDDRPYIEYLTPRTHWSQREDRWMAAARLADFYRQLRESVPFDQDPYLERLDAEEMGFVEAGYYFYQGAVLWYGGKRRDAEEFFEEFRQRVPASVQRLPRTLAREPLGDFEN